MPQPFARQDPHPSCDRVAHLLVVPQFLTAMSYIPKGALCIAAR
jgi:hypothetical protein